MLGGFAQHAVQSTCLVPDGDQVAHGLGKHVGVPIESFGHAHTRVQVVQHIASDRRHGRIAHTVAFFHKGGQRIEGRNTRAHH